MQISDEARSSKSIASDAIYYRLPMSDLSSKVPSTINCMSTRHLPSAELSWSISLGLQRVVALRDLRMALSRIYVQTYVRPCGVRECRVCTP